MECKACRKKGHVRRDCLKLRRNTKTISTEQRKQIIHECVQCKISPTMVGKKWKCNPDAIRTWVRKAGFQLPKKYKKVNSNYEPEFPNTSDSDDGIAASVGQDDSLASLLGERKGQDSSFASRDSVSGIAGEQGGKRKISNQSSDLQSKLSKLMPGTDYKTEESEKAVIFQPSQSQYYQAATQHSLPFNESVMLMDYSEMMKNEQDYPEPARIDGQSEEYYEDKEILKSSDLLTIEGQDEEYFESKDILKTSIQVLSNQDKKSSNLNAGAYNIASVHLELFRSSKSSSNKLSQIGCVVSGSSSGGFFKAIKPEGIEEYLDNYKLGGDLLQALHMTRQDDGTFLFRSRFEVIEEAEKIVCSEETEALASFLDFLQKYPNCIIVGVDEDTLAILVGKLKNVSVEKFRIISGFTYWKRVLKYLDVAGYKGIDLEDYYRHMVGEDLPSFTTALSIASVVMACVTKVASKEKGGRKSVDSDFYKLCKSIEHIPHPIKLDYDDTATAENVEVYSSFRPSVSATMIAEKLEQIILSESDSEPEASEECQGGVRGFVTATDDIDHDDTETAENVEVYSSLSPSFQPSIIQPFGQHSIGLQPTTVQQPTVQPCRLQPTTVEPSRGQPITVRSSAVQPSRLQGSTYWILGDPTPKEGTVLCPKCMARVRYSNIAVHMSKVHCNTYVAGAGRRCPVCQENIFLLEVAGHMPECCAQQSLRGTTAEHLAPTTARSAFHPGSSADNNPCCVLDSYLVKNFEPFSAGRVECLWIYKDYQRPWRREMFSCAKFLVAVVEWAMMNWSIDVRPAGIGKGTLLMRQDYSHLYFQGFRKKCADQYSFVDLN